MRKVVLQMQVSLDGFVGLPDGGQDWIFESFDDEYVDWSVATLWETGVHIMGGVTGRAMAGYWPSSTEPYAAPMNAIPKVIFSRTLESVDWNAASIERGDLGPEIARLKQESGKDIVAYSGASFAHSLTWLGLIDEYRLIVHPTALGDGLPPFPPLAAPLRLELLDRLAFGTSAAVHRYRPA